MSVSFDWNVRIGDVFILISGISVSVSFLFRSAGGIAKLQMAINNALAEISELKAEISQINKILTQLAVQEERLTMLTKWYDELRRGVGQIGSFKGHN